jgi:hypothetical protein
MKPNAVAPTRLAWLSEAEFPFTSRDGRHA